MLRYALTLVVALAVELPGFCQSPIRGFPIEDLKAQKAREDTAKAMVEPSRIQSYQDRMAAKPHHAGSQASKDVADYLVGQLKEWGLNARIEKFQALMPYPTLRTLEMVAPVPYKALLREPAMKEDKDTTDTTGLPTFNAYSASGDVTAQLVYVNYGVPADYEYLKRQGIDVRGKIVIARYGRGWRGVKAKVAQEHGATGCLIYSDPREDGYFQGDVYPVGPMRPDQSVQRGSVLDMSIYPGDPLSPGWAAEQGSKRLTVAESKTILKIPVMPISYGDAKPLLAQLSGSTVPEDWRGALPITYHTGPGPAKVHLKLDFDWSDKPLHDVIVTIPGSVYKDQWVIYGNHHDAWVNGANDPASAAASLMETARSLSQLLKQGWQPKRTIVLALWDGEEFGLIGSTEWAEKHLQELREHAAVYINSDSNGMGNLSVSGSPTLETFMKEVMRDVADPVESRSLLESAQRNVRDGSRNYHIGALGSGSDYVAFFDHAGIASLNVGFGSADAGVYHSVYDTLSWYRKFSDSDGTYGKALTQLTTAALLRLADAPVLPFEFSELTRAVTGYVEDIQQQAHQESGTVDFKELQAQDARLAAASKNYNEELAALMKRGTSIPFDGLLPVNQAVQRAEQRLLLPEGLPGRDWYLHQIYAPGLYTGYGVKTLPGIREAVEAHRWAEANQQVGRVTQALKAITGQVEDATRLLKQAGF